MDFFESKLSGTIAYFEIENKGVVTTRDTGFFEDEAMTRPIREQYQDGSSFSDGIDIDLNYAPTANWQIVFSYAMINSLTTLSAVNTLVEFKDTVGVPDHQASLWSKYTINEGSLDGFSLGLGLQYTGNRRLYSPSSASLGQGFEDVQIYGDPYWKVDFRIAYKGKLEWGTYSVAINVKNVFDEQAYISSGLPIDPRQIFFTTSLEF